MHTSLLSRDFDLQHPLQQNTYKISRIKRAAAATTPWQLVSTTYMTTKPAPIRTGPSRDMELSELALASGVSGVFADDSQLGPLFPAGHLAHLKHQKDEATHLQVAPPVAFRWQTKGEVHCLPSRQRSKSIDYEHNEDR